MSKHGPAALTIGLGAAILYLGAQAVTGRQGLAAYVDLQAQERALEVRAAALEVERVGLESRAGRLRGARVDEDYLEERARISLAAGGPEEIVFLLD